MEQQQQRYRESAWEAERERKGKDKATSSAAGRHAGVSGRVTPLGEPAMHVGQARQKGR